MNQTFPIKLDDYNRIVFFTGAGISAESGIPTYRGKGGFWSAYDYEEYACQRAFDADPEKVWDFHEERRKFVAGCQPNKGHQVIADIQSKKPSTKVITQNIDGLHQRAGSGNVIELHGSLWRVRCDREGIVTDNTRIPLQTRKCSCGDYLRPDIVWFEDMLDTTVLQEAIQSVAKSDLLITIGTSATVFPAADIPLFAVQRQITTVEINQEKTPLSHYYTYSIQGSASEILSRFD